MQDLTFKLQRLEGEQSKGGRGSSKGRKGDKGGVSVSKFGQIEKESSKVAIELNHGMLVETFKEFMFTNAENNNQ